MWKDLSSLVLFLVLGGVLAMGACRSRPLPEPPPAPEGPCTEVRLAVGCTVGRCTLAAPRRTLDPGQVVELAERALPETLVGDAIAPFLCEVTLPAGAVPKAELSLRVRLEGEGEPMPDAGAGSTATLFAEGSGDSGGPAGGGGGSGGPARLVPSRVFPGAVHGLITGSGRYGVTLLPPTRRTDEIGVDPLSSAGPAALLRNLSSQPVGAAFYDGQRLYVGNGPRVLVYDGLPATPTVRPRLVLGQPDLDTIGRGANAGASASRFDSVVNAIWSDGTRLLVATGNRILIWRALPERDFAPADAVLGQLDFSSNGANAGGVSARSLSRPMSIDSDGTRLFVADTLNNRVLLWQALPSQIAQPADGVLGQPSFTSAAREAGATPLYQAWGALFMPSGALVASLFVRGVQHVAEPAQNNAAPDFTLISPAARVQPDTISAPAGMVRTSPGSPDEGGGGGAEVGVAVRDTFGNRVALFRSEARGPRPIDVVLGQPDPLRQVSGPVYGSSLANNYPLGGGAGTLLVPDGNRLLVYERTPEHHYAPPDRVLGQAGFTTNEARLDYRGIAATTLAAPADVALTGELLAVADRGNNRVLVYRRRDLGNSGGAVPAAAAVLGQPDATSYMANREQLSAGAATLSGPAGVALDGTHLIVADSENHRVLVWNGVPSDPGDPSWPLWNGRPADLVLGQVDFSGRKPNHGRADADGDGYGDADADGFFYPIGVASDGVRLLVADRLNHRVLLWRTFPTRHGQPADAVLGQDDFHGNRANHGRGPYTVVADGFNLPTGVTLGPLPPSVPPLGEGALWVADTENNRVVRWDGFDSDTPRPTAFLGQPNGTTVTNLNYAPLGSPNAGYQQKPPTAAGSVLRPRGVALANGQIYVSETDSHRVHRFDAAMLVPAGVLGQVEPTSGVSNAGGLGAASLAAPLGLASDGQELWVADANNHRLLGWPVELPPAQGQAARGLVGQPTFAANGFDQSSTAAGGVVDGPRGLAGGDGVLYVADSDHHRVLALTRGSEGMGDMTAVRVYGQPDGSLVLPNAGGAPSAASLQSPAGVALDATHLIVADTGNHRVLVYDRASEGAEAVLVLGQTDFTRNAPNRGGAPDAGTLHTPQSVYSDGTFLAVADTGNHRVLVWSSFPTESGRPADVVLGQAGMGEVMPNRGGSVPDAGTMVFPAAVLGVGDALLVADSGNNRVLRFAGRPRSSGAAANGVFGQDAPTARVPATSPTDRDRLAGPSALATDGTYLYVLDRDLGRVVAYSLGVLAGGAGPAEAALILGGGAEGLTLLGPAGLAAERTAAFTTRLYLGDTGGDRVVVLGPVSRLAAD